MNQGYKQLMTDPRWRNVLIACLPTLAVMPLCFYLLNSSIENRQRTLTEQHGRMTAQLIAGTSAEFLLSKDFLSLNVMLMEGVRQGFFDTASVYSADNRLLANFGQGDPDRISSYTSEIHYQDSIAGHVVIGIDTEDSGGSAGALAITYLLTNLTVLILAWLMAFRPEASVRGLQDVLGHIRRIVSMRAESDTADTIDNSAEAPPATTQEDLPLQPPSVCFLVVRIRPERLASRIQPAVAKVLALYQGKVESRGEEEITATFTGGDDYCFRAVCAEALIQSCARRLYAYIDYKSALHCSDAEDENDIREAKRQTRYLCSLSRGKALASTSLRNDTLVGRKVSLVNFHSPIAPDREIHVIDSMSPEVEALIIRQSEQL